MTDIPVARETPPWLRLLKSILQPRPGRVFTAMVIAQAAATGSSHKSELALMASFAVLGVAGESWMNFSNAMAARSLSKSVFSKPERELRETMFAAGTIGVVSSLIAGNAIGAAIVNASDILFGRLDAANGLPGIQLDAIMTGLPLAATAGLAAAWHHAESRLPGSTRVSYTRPSSPS